ncbi:hypothetical protein BDR26DRAFT_1012537 [Obelidium mucronatum]|nr:hypothetical protein BDR26DRAFT_1012537 [Obelidium mucronatum]
MYLIFPIYIVLSILPFTWQWFGIQGSGKKLQTNKDLILNSIPTDVDVSFSSGRKLIVCIDGTWQYPGSGFDSVSQGGVEENTAMVASNIVKMAYLLGNGQNQHELDQDSLTQKVYYHSGVATGVNNKEESEAEANFGNIQDHLLDAYAWLAKEYKAGDEIYAFGFSRGATIVRSLLSFIRHSGLIHHDRFNNQESLMKLVDEALAHYKTRENNDYLQSKLQEFRKAELPPKNTPQIPCSYLTNIMSLAGDIEENDYHDLRIGAQLQYAYHAISIDENRKFFPPTMFETVDPSAMHPNATREQKWFRGSHADIGGGWWEHGLSDVTLDWMIQNARNAGLEVRDKEAFYKAFSPFLLGMDREFYLKGGEKIIHDYFASYPDGNSPMGLKTPRDLKKYMDATKFYKSELHESALTNELPAPLNIQQI